LYIEKAKIYTTMENISLILISDESSGRRTIEEMILNIRGYQVMLDRDLASLYSVETKVLNQAVKLI